LTRGIRRKERNMIFVIAKNVYSIVVDYYIERNNLTCFQKILAFERQSLPFDSDVMNVINAFVKIHSLNSQT